MRRALPLFSPLLWMPLPPFSFEITPYFLNIQIDELTSLGTNELSARVELLCVHVLENLREREGGGEAISKFSPMCVFSLVVNGNHSSTLTAQPRLKAAEYRQSCQIRPSYPKQKRAENALKQPSSASSGSAAGLRKIPPSAHYAVFKVAPHACFEAES